MDSALRRPCRFDRMVLVLPPDAPARAAILRYHLRDRPVADAAVVACVLLLAVVLITGVGMFVALVWLVLGVLGGLALVVRTVRRLRHG